MRPMMLAVCFILIASEWTGARAQETQRADKPILVLDAGHTATVNEVLFSRDDKELLTFSEDKTIRVWDVASGELLRTLRLPIGIGSEGKLYAAALDSAGTTLAVGGAGFADNKWGNIYILSLASGRIERVLTGHEASIFSLAFSSDGRRLISGSADQTARIWNVSTGQTEQVLRGHTGIVGGVTFSPDGSRCATASNDHTAAVWDVATGQRQTTLKGHSAELRCIAWRPDGLVLATGSDDQSIRLWSPEGKSYQGFNNLQKRGVTSVEFTADSQRLLYAANDYTVSRSLAAVLSVFGGNEVSRFDQHKNSIRAGKFSRDGALVATSDTIAETFLWKAADGTRVQKFVGRGRVPWSAAWSPVGTRIAWGTTMQPTTLNARGPLERTFDFSTLEFGPAPDDRFVRGQHERGGLTLLPTIVTQVGLVSLLVRQGERMQAWVMSDSNDPIWCYTCLAGDRAAVGSEFSLRLFDIRTGKRLREFQGHTGTICAVSSSPDGRYLLSAANDMTLRVWDPGRDEPLLSCFFTDNDWIVWTPEGYYAASAGGEKLMGWHMNNGREQLASFYPASQFRSTLYRPDVIKLLLKTGSVEGALAEADKARGRMTQKTEVADVLPPIVRITSPEAAEKKLSGADVEISAVATSRGQHPVTAMRLLIDGRPHEGKAGVRTISSPKVGDATVTWNVSLSPGKHRLQVLADSSASQGSSDELEVTYLGDTSLDAIELPTLYVLAVGISAYEGDLKLDYAAKDAEAIVATFQSKSKPLFRKIEVRTLTDKQATRAEILKGLGWLRKEVTQRDFAVFSFSGHGQKDIDGGLYFLPVDADPDNLSSTAILADQFKLPLTALPGKVIMLLDACHSGGVGTASTGRRKGAGELTEDLVRDLVTDESGVVMMCSSTGRESSLENNEARQGNFTLAIVEGLSGKADYNKDGHVYLNELDTYVTDRVKELTRGQQHPVTAKPSSIRSFPLAKP